MAAFCLPANPYSGITAFEIPPEQMEKDIADLYRGTLHHIKVGFPMEDSWTKNPAYAHVMTAYWNENKDLMPSVPEVFTHCHFKSPPYDEPRSPGHHELQNHTLRVEYTSMVLQPIRWVMAAERAGKAVLGDPLGEVTNDTVIVETTGFNAKADFDASGSVKGSYGVAQGSGTVDVGAGANWSKTTTVTISKTEKLEPDTYYTPVRIAAQLLCKVVRARDGWFAVHGSSGEWPDSCELVTTNPLLTEVTSEYYASRVGWVKSLKEFAGLYSTCGRDLLTLKKYGDFFWSEASSALLHMVVDPANAMLYVTGEARSFMEKTMGAFSGYDVEAMLKHDPNDNGHAISASLSDYRGLYSEENTRITEKPFPLSYSHGVDVAVWKTMVKN